MKDNGRWLKFNVPAFLEDEGLIKFTSNGSLIAVLIPLSHYQIFIVIDTFVKLSNEKYCPALAAKFCERVEKVFF